MQEVLTTRDVAFILNCSLDFAREQLVTGKIPGLVRAGRLHRIAAGSLRKWIERETLPKNPGLVELQNRRRSQRGAIATSSRAKRKT